MSLKIGEIIWCSSAPLVYDTGSIKTPLLRQPSLSQTDRLAPSTASMVPDTQKMSLEEWVAYEKSICAHSRASDAAERIKATQKNKNIIVLDLYKCHLHSVPPIKGCQHVTYYRLTANYLMQIPEDLGDLPNLTALSVCSNGLTKVPECTRYKMLNTLGVGGNPVRSLPPTLLDRKIWVTSYTTLITERQRKQCRAGLRRLKMRAFLGQFSWFPKRCLPQLTEYMPTFNGGHACDQGLRPFPFCDPDQISQAER